MVDINLLGEEEAPEPRPRAEDYESYSFEEPSTGGGAARSPEWGNMPQGQPEFEEIEKRRSWAPWIVFFLFLAVTAVVVFFVWRPFARRPTPVPVAPVAEAPDTSMARTSETPASALPQRIENLLARLPSGASLRSLSYTSGKFYLELEGGAEADVQSYTEGLKGTVTTESAAVRRRGDRTLVIGSLDSQEGSVGLLGLKPVTSGALEQLVRGAAESAGMRVARFSAGQRAKLDETFHTPFQVMLEGRLAAAQEVLHQLSDAGVAVQLTKLVITPLAPVQGQERTVRMVLHFDLLESS